MTPQIKLTELTVVTSFSTLVAIAFTPSEITAISIAVTALIATIFTGVVNIITALKVSATKIAVDEIHAKAEAIKGSVDGAASVSVSKINEMQRQIDSLVKQLTSKDITAAVLAQSKSDVAILKPIADSVEIHAVENDKR